MLCSRHNFVLLVCLYLQVVQHSLLDRPTSRCEASEDYKFGDCLRETIVREVGCQTFWSNYSDIRTCTTQKEVLQYHEKYGQLLNLERSLILERTGCLTPCTYMEYRVGGHPVRSYIKIICILARL